MKYAAYLSLSALIGTSTSAATIRGSDEDELIGPPRVFEEQQLIVESSSTGELSSSKWTHQEEEEEEEVSSISHSGGSRTLEGCDDSQLLRVSLSPDSYSVSDNEFILYFKEGSTYTFLAEKRGLFDGDYTICLSPGEHKFEAIDSYGDGILDGGFYKVALDGKTIFQTINGEWTRNVHKFDVLGTADNSAPSPAPPSEPEVQLNMADGTSFPTGVAPNPPNPPAPQPPAPQPTAPQPTAPQPTAPTNDDDDDDSVNDALIPPPPTPTPPSPTPPSDNVSTGTMTSRDTAWLIEHNSRRQKYHVQKGKSYVALKWSKYLKDSAQTWAEECARTGVFDHAWHLNIGENMAKHTSSSGTNRPPTNILTRWVENEMYDGYPGNGHMTQALWRSTHYVGCGEARKGNTYYQVCQYSKPGNCSVNGNNFWASVLADDTGCKGMPLLY